MTLAIAHLHQLQHIGRSHHPHLRRTGQRAGGATVNWKAMVSKLEGCKHGYRSLPAHLALMRPLTTTTTTTATQPNSPHPSLCSPLWRPSWRK